MKRYIAIGAVVVAFLPVWTSASPVTPADTIHPNIHQKVGDGSNANPNGKSPTGGGEVHGIANVPGQDGTSPNADGVNGMANELETVHGGIGDYNPQVD